MNRMVMWGTSAMIIAAQTLGAQDVVVKRQDPEQIKEIFSVFGGKMGLTGLMVSSSTTVRDTLGILITSVASGSAAEKAGLVEGNRISAINGVNLKLHPADAGQVDMQGIMQRRFQREISKVKPGDPVKLTVYADSRYREVTVQTEAPKNSTLHPFVLGENAEKASIGAIIGGTPSKRDTLGVLVMEIAENGPLAKNNIFEGSRIASIGGVDLRVPAGSAGDAKASADKANLLVTELGKLNAGAKVELRVYDSGRFRNVTVETMRRADLTMPGTGTGFFWRGGDNMFQFNNLEPLVENMKNLRLRVDSLTGNGQLHVLPLQGVENMRLFRREGLGDDFHLKLREGVEGIPLQILRLNGNRIWTSH